jgi:hypothetical protein
MTTHSASLAGEFKALRDRIAVLERASLITNLNAASDTVDDLVNVASGLTSSYTSFTGAATATVNVPPSGRVLVFLSAQLVLEVDGVDPTALYVSPAFSGANTIAASDSRASWRFNTGETRSTWFYELDGLTPGTTEVTLHRKRTSSATIVAAALASHSLVVVPL